MAVTLTDLSYIRGSFERANEADPNFVEAATDLDQSGIGSFISWIGDLIKIKPGIPREEFEAQLEARNPRDSKLFGQVQTALREEARLVNLINACSGGDDTQAMTYFVQIGRNLERPLGRRLSLKEKAETIKEYNTLLGKLEDRTGANQAARARLGRVMFERFFKFKLETYKIKDASSFHEKLMSNSDGKIRRIAMVIGDLAQTITLISLHESLDPEVEFHMLLEEGFLDSTRESLEINPQTGIASNGRKFVIETFKYSEDEIIPHSFARDQALYRNDGTVLSNKEFIERGHYGEGQGEARSANMKIFGPKQEEVRELNCGFGDTKTTANYIFVGPRAIKQTMDKFHISKEEAITRFEKLAGKKAIPILLNNSRVPEIEDVPRGLFHVDLFLTPLSDNHLLIGQIPDGHPELNAQRDYIESIVSYLEENYPQIEIHRYNAAILDGNPIFFNNMLIEECDGTERHEKKKLHIPLYVFDYENYAANARLRELNGEEVKMEEKFRSSEVYRTVARMDRAKVQAFIKEQARKASELAEASLREITRVCHNIYDIDFDFGAVRVPLSSLNLENDLMGGSLNCLTNEFREPSWSLLAA